MSATPKQVFANRKRSSAAEKRVSANIHPRTDALLKKDQAQRRRDSGLYWPIGVLLDEIVAKHYGVARVNGSAERHSGSAATAP